MQIKISTVGQSEVVEKDLVLNNKRTALICEVIKLNAIIKAIHKKSFVVVE